MLTGIGAYAINGTAPPIDVLALRDTTTNAATVQPIVNALNGVYDAGTYATSPLQLGEAFDDPSTGNGPSALVYNTKTMTLVDGYAVPGTLGSGSGVYRQVGRFELRPNGGTAAGDFYVYVDHYESGTGDAHAGKRATEAAVCSTTTPGRASARSRSTAAPRGRHGRARSRGRRRWPSRCRSPGRAGGPTPASGRPACG